MGYAQVLYLDALIALLVIGLIPFLRGREEPAEQAAPVPANAVLAPAAGAAQGG
jgi:hypothetical protein